MGSVRIATWLKPAAQHLLFDLVFHSFVSDGNDEVRKEKSDPADNILHTQSDVRVNQVSQSMCHRDYTTVRLSSRYQRMEDFSLK